MSAEVQCPAGCGPMEYKTNRNMKVRVFEPIGYALMIIGIAFIAVPESLPFDFLPLHLFPMQIVMMVIGIGMLMLGAKRTALVTTDLRCNTCTGVILESKSIDQKLKGDFLGVAENKAEYIRTALSSSTEESEHACPDCGEKMGHIRVPIEDGSHRSNLLVPDIVEDIQNLTTVSRTVKIDGCEGCDMLWFKKAKRENLLTKDSTIILKT